MQKPLARLPAFSKNLPSPLPPAPRLSSYMGLSPNSLPEATGPLQVLKSLPNRDPWPAQAAERV